ncbi:solute carrier family 12 member 4 isoform X6 [Lepeophtheirus salmonis]|uniref:solute carrier family 12 member 4 isoform X6 n=1 Tax=Lepeophtheirus salmonis TaxID=72036 RepID=UPI001AE23174|nr:solute carrier family 12 member 4-like isoform X6 [Lepeophtheirus salmonis]
MSNPPEQVDGSIHAPLGDWTLESEPFLSESDFPKSLPSPVLSKSPSSGFMNHSISNNPGSPQPLSIVDSPPPTAATSPLDSNPKKEILVTFNDGKKCNSITNIIAPPPAKALSPEKNADLHPEGDSQDDDHLIKNNKDSTSTNLYLYQDEERPHMASAISSMANYSATIQSRPTDPDAKPVQSANLGTLMGVYLPCIQNIFGVILFIRMTWIVGTAGAVEGFFVVFMGCCVTLLTAISMAAIATNGVVPGGGSYFMISRALGPEFGGAVGILFYLATSVAAAMYIIGAIEILIIYIVGPAMSLFGPDITNDFVKFNNYRVYGTFLLITMGTIVFIGVRFVNKFAAVALACVLLSIVSIYVGIFVNIGGNDKANFCVLGTRIVRQVNNCTKEQGSDLFEQWCKLNGTLASNDTSALTPGDYVCDEYFNKNEAFMKRGIRGLWNGTFYDNVVSTYKDVGDSISSSSEEFEYNLGGAPKRGYITSDIYTSFVILVGIFFPSCTGIMAGSNRSGDLADPQKSIPIGTIMAILTTSTVYLSSVLLFAATVDPLLLRDKFGESIGGSLVVGNIAWPHPKVVEIGSLLSTIGAGLQSLTGAPRLLQAIAKDGIIPFLAPFQVQSAKGEPVRALGITLLICEVAVLIGNVDEIAPLLSMFFLMCYGFVNLACALQTLLRTPNWRPRFKYYHWSLSLLGVVLCIAVMFMSSWYYALLAMGIAGIIYKYIEYRGAEKEWGDGIRGLALSAARFSLLRLEEGPPHTKNWRPQILILAKLDSQLKVKHKRLFALASQLKAGKGLTIGVTVLDGHFGKMYGEAQAAKFSIQQVIKDEAVKGFADVVVSKDISDGVCHLTQTTGLGGMKPNTVILGWPNSWRKKEEDSWKVFVDSVRYASAAKMALLVPKGIQRYPDSGDKVKGNIDIWWIVHDGGLLMLLPFLLKQHRTWKNCKLRIFSVAQHEDNSIQMKKDLKTFLYHLRIEADVEVVEMQDSDISEYTYERTLLMEQRNEMLKEMRVSDKRKGKMVETVIENSRADVPNIEDKIPPKVKFSEEIDEIEEDNELQGNSLTVPKSSNRESSNVRRMHTAVRLNEVIVNKSHDAKLVILNLPSPPKIMGPDKDASYMEFLEVLTEGLERVLMVRGGGREVITIYS